MDEDVVFADVADRIAIVDRLVLESSIRGFDDDFGLVTGGAQDTADAEHFMADGVAVAERREHLMDAHHVTLRGRMEERRQCRPLARRSVGGARTSLEAVPWRAAVPWSAARTCRGTSVR